MIARLVRAGGFQVTRQNKVQYEGTLRQKDIDYLFDTIVRSHYPQVLGKTVHHVRSSSTADCDYVDVEFDDRTSLHIRLEPLLRIKAVLWSRKNGTKKRVRVYSPVLVLWRARPPRPDPWFTTGKNDGDKST